MTPDRFFRGCALLVLVTALIGCSASSPRTFTYTREAGGSGGGNPAAAAPAGAFAERDPGELAPGHLVRLAVLEDPNLNGEFRIEFDGQLRLPYSVSIDTTGMQRTALRSALLHAYRGYFKNPPTLTASVVDRERFVEVRGLVNTPGQYLVAEKSSLDEVIAKAGGLQKAKDSVAAAWVRINRLGTSRAVKLSEYYSGAEGLVPSWQGGEEVFFQSDPPPGYAASSDDEGFVQLLGEVASPGEYLHREGADFVHYLTKAGGPTQAADLGRVEVIRTDGDKRRSTVFALGRTAEIPEVRAGDIVIVHARYQSPLISNVTAVISTIATAVLAGAAL